MRIGTKELQKMTSVQMCHLQQTDVSPEVAGTRRRHEVPVVFCAVRISAKC